MADTCKTTADVIAWLRRPREGENAYLTAWRDEIADRLEAAYKRESGNAAKLREALCEILSYIESFRKYITPGKGKKLTALFAVADTILSKARAALAVPPRNCDVGTAEEQSQRFDAFCDEHKYVGDDGANWCSRTCPCYNDINCGVKWAQLPYEEGGAK